MLCFNIYVIVHDIVAFLYYTSIIIILHTYKHFYLWYYTLINNITLFFMILHTSLQYYTVLYNDIDNHASLYNNTDLYTILHISMKLNTLHTVSHTFMPGAHILI